MLADIGANPACKQNPNGAGTALTALQKPPKTLGRPQDVLANERLAAVEWQLAHPPGG